MAWYDVRWLFVVSLVLCLAGCKSPPPYDGSAMEVRAMGKSFQKFQTVEHGAVLSGVTTGLNCAPVHVLFLHGAPGDWRAWGRYLGDKDIQAKTQMVAIDRPGYAGSGKGQSMGDLSQQTARIAQGLLAEGGPGSGPYILIGHSYGASLALQFLQDYPDMTSGVLFLAGSLDPALEQRRWYHIAAKYPPVRWIVLGALKTANDEIYPLQGQLKDLHDRIGQLPKVPITLIQGEKDQLVHPKNTDYAARHFQGARVLSLPHQGHFLPWEQYDLVKAEILDLVTRAAARSLNSESSVCPKSSFGTL